MPNLGITIGGYALAVILFWLLLGAKEDLGKSIEQCNTDKMAAVAEAEKIARDAAQSALERRLSDMEEMLESEAESRSIAILARQEAENEAVALQETIRILQREATNDETVSAGQACLNIDVPDAITERLRANQDS